jgi:NAD(P)H-hydrate epimerase
MNKTPKHTDRNEAAQLCRPRAAEVHKGDMGHAALLAGSYGMLGAVMLSARGCMRSGAGKLTVFAEPSGYPILQGVLPEAVFQISEYKEWFSMVVSGHYDALAYGPGIGLRFDNERLISTLFKCGKPLILDADGLNQLAKAGQKLMSTIPPMTILTPHAAEYQRLFGLSTEPEEVSRRFGIILVMKGKNTRVIGPDGGCFINMSGNAGLATAGSGDVLTGMILGLLARGYDPLAAARLGVYLHGRAGDLASARFGEESMVAGDLPDLIGEAYKELTDIVK